MRAAITLRRRDIVTVVPRSGEVATTGAAARGACAGAATEEVAACGATA